MEKENARERAEIVISIFFFLNMGLNFSFWPHKNWDFTSIITTRQTF